MLYRLGLAGVLALSVGGAGVATTQGRTSISGSLNLVVIRVAFTDIGTTSRFTAAQTQSNFDNVAQLWGTDTSYGNLKLKFQIVGPYTLGQPSTTYLDAHDGTSSTSAGIVALANAAVAKVPAGTVDWSNVYGVLVVFADTRAKGFYTGITLGVTAAIAPPGSTRSYDVHESIVGENPQESVTGIWGRWAHEVGHQLQRPGGPAHPSNYQSSFEEMDFGYPAQSGVFSKQASQAFPDWLPTGKYKTISPPNGGSVGLLAEEQPPSLDPDFQAIKAKLTFGGRQIYYLISARRATRGDDIQPIPDQGVLIERVVEGGNPNLDDCAPDGSCPRWVELKGKGGDSDKLWHKGDTYSNRDDGIFITVRSNPDPDHYVVDVTYTKQADKPDVGINSWLEPPGNTYETTDLWVDSPVNGYGTYRYPSWSDLMGGTVPSGNGDDPGIGLVNRLYARVRNFGARTATNVVVHFDVSTPLGVGVSGPNGFAQLGTVTSAQFPGLASIPPGGSVDVYVNWTPNVSLSPAQIQAGRFSLHSCVRVRIDHVAGETFFANQDGNGQQENIAYFEAGSASTPGAPGAPNASVMYLRNDSASIRKQFVLGVVRDQLPASWNLTVNDGNPVVDLAPGEVRAIPITVKQTAAESVGASHTIGIFAESEVTLTNPRNPADKHYGFVSLGGVQVQVAVLKKPSLHCQSAGNGRVTGNLSGVGPGQKLSVYVVGIGDNNRFLPKQAVLAPTGATGGQFSATFPGTPPKHAVCLFAGTTHEASASSEIFPM